MRWLTEFAEAAATTDQLVGRSDHGLLLAAGLSGEVGSIASELKKERRDVQAFTSAHQKLVEEVGDYLWYYVRLASILSTGFLQRLGQMNDTDGRGPISVALDLVNATGDLVTLHLGSHSPKLVLQCR